MSEPDRVTVARAALAEAGRVDLAERVRANRRGDPAIDGWAWRDHRVIQRAFRLGHLADPGGAPIWCGHDADEPTPDLFIAACDDCTCVPLVARFNRRALGSDHD